jgi:hypothetical protein
VYVEKLLVLLLTDDRLDLLRDAIVERGVAPSAIYVVAPAHVGVLQWLASDEDAAVSEARARALGAEWILADQAEVAGEAGEFDPVLAVEDALRRFAADEILVVAISEEAGLEMALRRFGLPVSRLPGTWPVGKRGRIREAVRALASGRSSATPFVFFVAANLALLVLAALISLVVLLALRLL